MKIVTVKTVDDLDIVLRVVRAMLEASGSLAVIVKKAERNLSEEQRKLYWSWVGIIGSELGYEKDEMHQVLKEQYLTSIYLHDPDNHPGFAEMVAGINAIKGDYPAEHAHIRRQVLRLISTMDATVTNMRDYLNAIKQHAINYNIALPLPEMQGILEENERRTVSKLPRKSRVHALRGDGGTDSPSA